MTPHTANVAKVVGNKGSGDRRLSEKERERKEVERDKKGLRGGAGLADEILFSRTRRSSRRSDERGEYDESVTEPIRQLGVVTRQGTASQ